MAARYTIEDTHQGEIAGIPGNGKHIRFPGIDIWQLRDGKLIGHWFVGDIYGFVQQVGAVPTPAAG